MDDQNMTMAGPGGLDRRTLLKRGAVVGGAAVWATPVVQSLAAPAWAAGSPRGCPNPIRFKYDAEQGTFDSGDALGNTCLPDGYSAASAQVAPDGSIPGHDGKVEVVVSTDKMSARIYLPPGCTLVDADAKAGSANSATSNQECDDADCFTPTSGRPYCEVALQEKEISYVAGVICC